MSHAADPVGPGRIGEPDRAEKRVQTERILTSGIFRKAPLLQKFLQFITDAEAEGRCREISEYAVAVEVLGRKTDFDPASDTVVRTQAFRLRMKLKEFYEAEGLSDPILIEIPKGHYVPEFTFRQFPVAADSLASLPGESPRPPRKLFPRIGPRREALLAIAGLLLFLGGVVVGSRWLLTEKRTATVAPVVPEVAKSFWTGCLGKTDYVILAYSNSVFLATEMGDLLRFSGGAVADSGAMVARDAAQAIARNPALAARAGPIYYEDGYTGTGEVMAVYSLTRLLTTLGVVAVVKRSRQLSVDDLRNHNVIFLGSPFENQVLSEIHTPQRFMFQQPKKPPYLWRGQIVDTNPGPDGTKFYELERDKQLRVIQADYALFDVLPGLTPGRKMVILAGLTTSGTQGAAEFAASAEGLRQILAAVGVGEGSTRSFPTYFEAVLRVETARGLDAVKVKFIKASVAKGPE